MQTGVTVGAGHMEVVDPQQRILATATPGKDQYQAEARRATRDRGTTHRPDRPRSVAVVTALSFTGPYCTQPLARGRWPYPHRTGRLPPCPA
jgi:hypothetical protein